MTDMMWKIDRTPEIQRKPEDIIKEQCSLLNKELNGIVRGNIQKYDGSISEYISAPLQVLASATSTLTTPRSVQTILGETGESRTITYELFLSAPAIPSYQYRILFLQHGLSPYPVHLYVEEQVLNSTQLKSTSISLNNEEEFVKCIEVILGSVRITEIIRKMATYK